MLNRNISQMSLVREARKAVVENISKQLEYVTRAGPHSNANNIKFKTGLFFNSFYTSLI